MAWYFTGDRPIYAQLIERLRLRIITGEYPPGSRLPSVRELAELAGVNPNTMQRALAELEGLGIVLSQRTSGRFVTEDVHKIAELRQALAVEKIRCFFSEMQGLGYDWDSVLELLEKEKTV